MNGEENPYPGARPFAKDDQDRFFGRPAESLILADMWRQNRLTLATGRTASGKTSLLHAGVLPVIASTTAETLLSDCSSHDPVFPSAAFPGHDPYTLALLRSWSPGESTFRLAGLTIHDFIRHRTERHSGDIFAAIDHAEELVSDSGQRRSQLPRFLAALADASREEPRLHLLLMVREDAADLLTTALGNGARFHVGPLSRQAAIEAVTGPVTSGPRTFADGAAEAIVDDLMASRMTAPGDRERRVVSENVEPTLLQAVCTRLWAALPAETSVIDQRSVRRYSDPDMALASHVGLIITTVAEDYDVPAARLRSWLNDNFVTEMGTQATVYEGLTTTADMPNAVAHALGDMHLLAAERRAGARWYSLLADRVITPLRESGDVSRPPVEPASCLRASRRALVRGDLDLAEQYASQAVRIAAAADFRSRAEAHSVLGNVEYERAKPIQAESRYRAAADLFEASGDTRTTAQLLAATAQALIGQGRMSEAIAELRAALARRPNDLMLQTELALILWSQGQGQAAVAILTSVLGIDGSSAAVLLARGIILAELGDARRALADLDRITSRASPLPRAARGLALMELGDLAAANQEIESALDMAPRNGMVLLFAAQAMKLSGDTVTATALAGQAADAADPALSPYHHELSLRLADKR